jgi:hypothetical protein
MEYTKYRWLMGDEKHFSAATDSQFLTGLRSTQMQSRTDDAAFMRDMAMLATDWTGKPVQYTKIDLPLEYAVRWLSVAPIVRENSAGTLTDFQKERINRLMDAIDEYPVSNLDEKGQKILLQCVDEISTLVDSVA